MVNTLVGNQKRRLYLLNRHRKIPFIQQLEAADCGACCLAMVLRFFGSEAPVTEVREVIGTTPFGVTMSTLVDAGQTFGLKGRAIRVHWTNIEKIPRGAILHWEFNHVVVFDGVESEFVNIIDPGVGRRSIPIHDFSVKFTGLAMEFEPAENFSQLKYEKKHLGIDRLKDLLKYPDAIKRVMLASIIIQLIGIVFPALTGFVIDTVLPVENRTWVTIIGLGASILVIFGALADLARSYSLIHLRAKYDYYTTTSFVRYLLDLPFSFFQRRSVGDLMLRVHSNTNIREIMSAAALSAVLDGFLVSAYGILLLIIAPMMSTVCLAIGTIQVALLFIVRPKLAEFMAEEQFSKSESHSKLVQILSGIHTLKGVGAEPEGLSMWETKFVTELNCANKRQIFRANIDSVIYFIQTFSPIIVLCVGAAEVLDGTISLGGMLAASALSLGLLRPLVELTKNLISIFEIQIHFERIHDVVSHPPEQLILANSKNTISNLKGNVLVKNLSFTYEGSKSPALDGISFSIEPGQKIAIVGSTGCGKSTLAHILLGLYKPQIGSVFFDGVDLHESSLRSLRRKIGFVPQDPYLFEGSVRQNISLTCPEASLAEVVRVAKLAGIHNEIMEMINGYDTRLIGGGKSISGGQRQRIAIARAMIGNPKILILDEATSSLDSETELVVSKNLRNLNCTQIVVAHRLSTVQNSDLLLVMNRGKIVEFGRHDDLLKLDGEYKRLLGAQILTSYP